jgi:hypothetical protein
MTIKENLIRDYIQNIDFNRDDWKLSQMKKDMKAFLGEEPGIDIIYTKDVIINEEFKTSKEIKKISKIEVIFFDTDEKFKKLEFLI